MTGKHNERLTGGREHTAEAGDEPFEEIVASPRSVTLILGKAAEEGRIAQNQIKTLTSDRREEVAVTHLYTVLDPIEQHIDARTADSVGIDINRRDPPAA